MPRLRLFAKIGLSVMLFLIMIKVLNEKPPEKIPSPPLTTEELMEKLREENAKENWIWKDFRQYDALRCEDDHSVELISSLDMMALPAVRCI